MVLNGGSNLPTLRPALSTRTSPAFYKELFNLLKQFLAGVSYFIYTVLGLRVEAVNGGAVMGGTTVLCIEPHTQRQAGRLFYEYNSSF